MAHEAGSDAPRPLLRAILCVAACACQPSAVVHDGIPSFQVVDEGLVFRSAQLTTREQWAKIRAHGVRRVLKLNFPGEGEDDLAVAAGLEVTTISMEPRGDQDVFDNLANTFRKPTPEQLDQAERFLESARPLDPVLVHCQLGRDRTGLVIARYRVLHDGWTKDRANAERLASGASRALHGVNDVWEDWRP